MYGKRSTWDVIREIPFGDISSTYAAVGGVTTKATRAVKITNTTDVTIYFTIDSSEDQLKLPTNSYQLWDVTTNKALGDKPQFIEVGTQFYCRGIEQLDPSSGWVSVETLIVKIGS